MEPVVVDMHTKNGLLAEIEAGDCLRRYEAEQAALDWISDFPRGMPLAGNTVHFDKAWIKYHMPILHSYFHYRVIDVTSFNEMAARINPALWAGRPGGGKETAHRALADALESMNTLRYYKDHGLFLP
jgi:oligoribonuclease